MRFFGQKSVFRLSLLAAVFSILLFSAAACGGGGEQASENEDNGPIVFAGYSWGSAQLHNQIARYIVENGYRVETDEIPGETVTLWTAMAQGDVDVAMEIWVENQQELYDQGIADGTVEDLGVNFPDSVQGFFVPDYVVHGDAERGIEPMAPDLKSVSDLPKYWQLFKDPENPNKGRIYNGIAGWECTEINKKKLEVYDLSDTFDLFDPGSGAALSGSLVSAYDNGEPWVGYYWGPTWIFGELNLYQLEEPEYDPDVFKDTAGCAYPSVQVHICVNSAFPDKYPEITEFLKNYNTTMQQVSEGLAYMRDNDVEADQAAIWFLKEKEDIWTQWVPDDVAQNVKAALAEE